MKASYPYVIKTKPTLCWSCVAVWIAAPALYLCAITYWWLA